MKVLIVGSGGREHTLAWSCSRSDLKPKVYCAPGNGGTARIAENINISADNLGELKEFVKQEKIDLTVVGPEAPLVGGLTDMLSDSGCEVFGPAKTAAKIEGSKVFSTLLMQEAGVPSAGLEIFDRFEEARQYILGLDRPPVVKASGLAAGKGAIICKTVDEAVSTAETMLVKRKFGEAGSKIVVEEHLTGVETSLMAFVDGEDYLLLAPSRDHKRVFDNDEGPNTGGMGAFSPLDDIEPETVVRIAEVVIPPVLKKLVELGTPYRGLLYPGLMLTDKNALDRGVKVLEFNCRFGDPEAQVVLPILTVDALEIMLAVAEGRLKRWMGENGFKPNDWQKLTGDRHAVTVVAAAEGYPDSYKKGMKIEDLPQETDTVIPFHAGTKLKDGELYTSGGRVLAITGLGSSHKEAVETAYQAIDQVRFEGVRFRRDIGRKEYW